jgi:hypothetical protein
LGLTELLGDIEDCARRGRVDKLIPLLWALGEIEHCKAAPAILREEVAAFFSRLNIP